MFMTLEETKSFWSFLPKCIKNFLKISDGLNTYASDKYYLTDENVISGGNKNTIEPCPNKSYYITAGSSVEERKELCKHFKSIYIKSTFFTMTPIKEGEMIKDSLENFFVKTFYRKTITIICSGKTTVHFITVSVSNILTIYHRNFCCVKDAGEISKIMKSNEIKNVNLFFLGGIFSVATKKIFPKMTKTKYLTCDKEFFCSRIHFKNSEDKYPEINGELGEVTMNKILEFIPETKKIIVGGR